MGLFNDNAQKDHPDHLGGSRGPPGPQGPPRVGYDLTSSGNYDIDGND